VEGYWYRCERNPSIILVFKDFHQPAQNSPESSLCCQVSDGSPIREIPIGFVTGVVWIEHANHLTPYEYLGDVKLGKIR